MVHLTISEARWVNNEPPPATVRIQFPQYKKLLNRQQTLVYCLGFSGCFIGMYTYLFEIQLGLDLLERLR